MSLYNSSRRRGRKLISPGKLLCSEEFLLSEIKKFPFLFNRLLELWIMTLLQPFELLYDIHCIYDVHSNHF